MMIRGVRQVPTREAELRSPSVVDIQISPCRLGGSEKHGLRGSDELMHSHENPNGRAREISRCIAALQIGTGSCDELTKQVSGRASGVVLCFFCST
jgi:hypothetical protein